MVTGLCPASSIAHSAHCWPAKAVEMAQILGTLYPYWNPEEGFWLLVLDRLISGCCSHLGNGAADGRFFSLSPSLCKI